MRRKYVIAIAIAATIAGFAYWYASTPRTGNPVQLPPGTPVSTDILVFGKPLTTITNPEGQAVVMDMLRSGRSAKEHECKNRGTMELHFTDGQAIHINYLPGHHFLHYEFRVNGSLYAVSRARFMRALEIAGVDVHEIPTK